MAVAVRHGIRCGRRAGGSRVVVLGGSLLAARLAARLRLQIRPDPREGPARGAPASASDRPRTAAGAPRPLRPAALPFGAGGARGSDGRSTHADASAKRRPHEPPPGGPAPTKLYDFAPRASSAAHEEDGRSPSSAPAAADEAATMQV